ncbi:hypothetical protein PG993_012664 [Apiospora rasikravindrae]|uniref:SNF2 N-terminal domain-containing protein n=1 Tax=Apiospora rasikravindrae TaxID=990691 RepID=A0ABR1S397_9PEZI
MANNGGNVADAAGVAGNAVDGPDLRNRLGRIEEKLDRLSRNPSHIMIRIAGPGTLVYQNTIGAIANPFTSSGSLNWDALKRWVVTQINHAVREEFMPGDENDEVFVLNVAGTARQAIDRLNFITTLVQWELGELNLPVTNTNMPYIEFESTKLVQGDRPVVEEPEVSIVSDVDEDVAEQNRIDKPEDRVMFEVADDASDGGQVFDDVSRHAEKLDSGANWNRVRQFFRRPGREPNQFILPNLAFPIEGYQAAAVLWLLTRIPDDKVSGPLLSDDMGLGKTFTTIVTMMAHSYLQSSFRDVLKYWEQADLAEQQGANPVHNPEDAPAGKPCPSQDRNRFWLQCPCEVGSAARAIVTSMSDLPNIIISPSGGASLWISEWDKFVQPRSGMALYVSVSGYQGTHPQLDEFCRAMGGAQLAGEAEIIEETMRGPQRRNGPVVKRRLIQRRHGFAGGSSNALLVTAEGCGPMQQPVMLAEQKEGDFPFVSEPVANEMQNYHSAIGVPVAGCGILAMDEMHKYKGESHETLPFKMLSLFRYQAHPTLAVGVSGNLLGIGPEAWQRHVWHTQDCIERHKFTADLGRIQTRDTFKKLREDWNYMRRLINELEADKEANIAGDRTEFERYRDKIAEDYRQGLGKMIIRRLKKDSFLGVKILDIAAPVTRPLALKMPEGPALNSLSVYFRRISQWMHRVYEEEVAEWRRHGGEGAYPRPARAKAQQGLLADGVDGKKVKTERQREAYYLSTRAVTFPLLAYFPNSDNDRATRRLCRFYEAKKPLADLASQFTKATLDPKRTLATIRDMLNQSPFMRHRDAMRENSPKFQELVKLVRDQLVNTRLAKIPENRQPDKGPADESYVRHMVVFAEWPVNAYLTALYLQADLINDVEVILIHQALKERTPRDHCRKDAFEYFDAPCTPRSKNKVLVGTYTLISTMHNFQRASSAVLLDVTNVVERDQARCRIYRRGPDYRDVHYRHRRNEGNSKMGDIQWENFGVKEGNAGEEEEEEEENIYDVSPMP